MNSVFIPEINPILRNCAMYVLQEKIERLFDNAKWRTFIDCFCKQWSKKNNIQIHGICAWGFEVFENNAFLAKNIRRYFCYFGGQNLGSKQNVDRISANICQEFLRFIRQQEPRWAEGIVCLLSQEKATLLKEPDYQCKATDKLLSAYLAETDDILAEYSDYIIASIASFIFKIGEVKTYETDIVFRWRVFQLYLILEHLFGHYTAPLSDIELRMKMAAIHFNDNQVAPFYQNMDEQNSISEYESFILNNFVFKRMEMIFEKITQGDTFKLKQRCFHTGDELTLNINQEVYLLAKQQIETSYKRFYI